MISVHRLPGPLRQFLIAASCAAICGCTSTTVIDASSTPARSVGADFTEQQLLDVGIAIFEEGLAPNEKYLEQELIDPNVRRAEARYLAYNLRNTLERTENWGAVRLIPRESRAIDLMVYGEIKASTGIELELKIRAVDATGETWLKKTYEDVASALSYREEIGGDEDAFQDIYNEIADDLLEAYLEREQKDITRIRKTALLHFAEDIAPYAFDDYLSEGKRGSRTILKLPADGDPMLARVEKIREREYMFVDLLDEHYKAFHKNMSEPYSDWRRYTYEELLALRDLKRAALATKLIGAATVVGGIAVQNQSQAGSAGSFAGRAAVLGGASAVMAGFSLGSEAKMHSAAVRELDESFRSQIDPLVVEVEGQTTTLSGTAEEQYEEWRRLLRAIYEQETGIDLEDGESEPALPEVRFDQ
ncbi:MAG: hypothetical protein AB8G17_14660 [Gammaproteobacteria bacterium]